MSTVAPIGAAAVHGHRFLLRIGLSLANIFAWVFVFDYFYSLSASVERALIGTVLLYALSQLLTFVLTPLSAAHLARGVKQSIIWGSLACAAAYVFLGAAFLGLFVEGGVSWGVVAFAVLLGVYRALYWVPYRVALATTHAGGMSAFYEFAVALMPLFAGLTMLSVPFGAPRILFGAAAFLLLSVGPASLLPMMREKFSWPYAYTYQQLFRRRNGALVLVAFFDGLQGAALFLMWPLAVFLILDWSYAALGLVGTLTLLSILLLRRFYARFVSFMRLETSPAVHATFAASGFVARMVAGNPVGIILADAYSYASLPLKGTTADPFVFEQATDKGSFIDEYTTLKELAAAAGRIALCMTVIALLLSLPLPFAFAAALAIAAFSAGLSVFLGRVTLTTA